MNIIINPGSGAVDGKVSWENAYENIKAYISECEIPMRIVRSEHEDDGGRYLFVLRNDEYKYEIEVEMPGLPLGKVRYIEGDKRNVFDFPRLYVDGSSWLWYLAVVRKELIKDTLEYKREEMLEELKKINSQIEELESECDAE